MDSLFYIPKTGKPVSCIACGLYKHCSHPKMKVQGKGKKRILLVGTAPNKLDDVRGAYWQGRDGRLLQSTLAGMGIDIEDDCHSINAANCLSINKKKEEVDPSNLTVDACRKFVLMAIEEVKPLLIIAFGPIALLSLVGSRIQKTIGPIHKWRGYTIPDRQYEAWVAPVFHPQYVLENSKYPEVETVWKQDLENALQRLKMKLPIPLSEEGENVHVLDREIDIRRLLKKLQTVGSFAWDIETTGIKPHNTKEHFIAMTSFAFNDTESYVIPGELSEINMRLLKRIMEDPKIGKFAHNMKYEHTWYHNIYGIHVQGWQWDSMQAAHVLNNYSGTTGLKFQAIVQFGIYDYNSEIEGYLHSSGKSANEVNNIQAALDNPGIRQKMSVYCGVDSLLTYKLTKLQKEQVGKDAGLVDAYWLTHYGILALFEAEQQGMSIDVVYIHKQMKRLSKRVEILEKQLNGTKLIRQWKQVYGSKFNLASPYQLEHLLYRVNKYAVSKETASGKGSTDDETLRLLNISELDTLLQWRKFLKLRDVYFKGFLREQVDGILHTSFNLHIAVTYRSSSNNPNFQNIPKRDKESMKLIRRAIYPSKGNQLMEFDFSKLEVSIAACYHKDPTMMAYLRSDSNDMHGDLAQQIFKIKEFDKHIGPHATLRNAAKNGFIFPQFYGDYYKNNAESLRQWVQLPKGTWRKDSGMPMPEGTLGGHMITNGIRSFDSFTKHLKGIEDDFWNNRFKVYKRWKEKWVRQYAKQGHIRMLTGFQCGGVMRKNEVINYPVQGAAFHCLMWSFVRITNLLNEKGYKTKIIGQIHDAIVFDIYPPELEKVYDLVIDVTTKQLPKHWSWITAPLAVEAEICGIDKPWSEKKDYIK